MLVIDGQYDGLRGSYGFIWPFLEVIPGECAGIAFQNCGLEEAFYSYMLRGTLLSSCGRNILSHYDFVQGSEMTGYQREKRGVGVEVNIYRNTQNAMHYPFSFPLSMIFLGLAWLLRLLLIQVVGVPRCMI